MRIVNVNAEFCKGCLLCQSVCPSDGFKQSEHPNAAGILPVVFDSTKECKACLACVLMCPDAAIEIYEMEETDDASGVSSRRTITAESRK